MLANDLVALGGIDLGSGFHVNALCPAAKISAYDAFVRALDRVYSAAWEATIAIGGKRRRWLKLSHFAWVFSGVESQFPKLDDFTGLGICF